MGVLHTYICCTRLHVRIYSNTSTRSLALDKNPTSSLGSRGCGPDSAIMRAKRQIRLSMLQRARCTRGLPPLLMQHQVGHRSVRLSKIGNPVAADCAILLHTCFIGCSLALTPAKVFSSFKYISQLSLVPQAETGIPSSPCSTQREKISRSEIR